MKLDLSLSAAQHHRGKENKSNMYKMGPVRGALNTGADVTPNPKDLEVRPCGMAVQLRDEQSDAQHAGPLIKVKVSFGSKTHEICISAYSTFGDLKNTLVQDTGLQPRQQRLYYKGKEKDNKAYLHDAGIKNKSKIVLVEDSTRHETKLTEIKKDEAIGKACRAIADIQLEVDQLAEKVFKVEATVQSGRRVRDNAFTETIEMFMVQLLKLDGISAEGDAKTQRRILVRRVQKYVETLDALKIQNDLAKPNAPKPSDMAKPNPPKPNDMARANAPKPNDLGRANAPKPNDLANPPKPDLPKAVTNTVVTTKWETFDTGAATGPTQTPSGPTSVRRRFSNSSHNNHIHSSAATGPASIQLTEWERFD